jgi:integrase/recombinase XerD
MGELREQMLRSMRLRGLSEYTQKSYTQAVAGLAAYYRIRPDQLKQVQIEAYLDHLEKERKLAPSSCHVAWAALRFFYQQTLGWTELQLRLPQRRGSSRLPEILTPQELERLFQAPTNPKHRVLLMTAYSAGLRVGELVRLRVSDIDSDPERRLIRVEQGKGRKDRYTVLSPALLGYLRDYWKISRPRRWLFPSPTGATHICRATAQRVFYRARVKAGIRKRVSIHSLRHGFATALLEKGVDLRTIQVLMGHRSFSTTARYIRVIRPQLPTSGGVLDLLAFPQISLE